MDNKECTAAPWRVVNDITVKSAVTGCKIAECGPSKRCTSYQKSNAHLIAAAPDMLAALEGILSDFHLSVKTDLALEEFPALHAVDMAIKQAKGIA